MAKAKKKTAAAELPRTTAAMVHGADAFGARYTKPGFAFTPDQDLKFALGWPQMVELVEGHPSDQDPLASAIDALRPGYPFIQVAWPKEVAARIGRAFVTDQWFNLEAGRPAPPYPSLLEILATPGPITADEARRLVRDRLTSPYPSDVEKLM